MLDFVTIVLISLIMKWNYHACSERISCNMCTKQRQHKANKDNMTYIKEQRSINKWPCVQEVYLVVQLGFG